MKRAHEDHSHHGRQKDCDEDRVDETEPLHVVLRGGAQDVVPTRRPAHIIIYLMEERERGVKCIQGDMSLEGETEAACIF